MSRHPELPERDRRILGALVQAYIDHGEPISSLWLASRGFGISSATLRNVLARLEEQGYVRQPHTSAGRVPTDLGYRCYVDQLLTARRTSRPAPQVEARLRRAGTVDDLLSHARSEEHTSELQSQSNLVCRLLHEKKKQTLPHTFNFPSRARPQLRLPFRHCRERATTRNSHLHFGLPDSIRRQIIR